MSSFFKRCLAYVIDIIIVFIITTIITSNSYINKDYVKYTEKYDEYMKYSNEYSDNIKELEEKYEKEEIDKKVYEKEMKKLNDQNITTQKNYSYELSKLSTVSSIIRIMVVLLYFVVIQFYFDGKTLGKRIMKLKVVPHNKYNLTIFNYFVRSLILNNVLVNIINIIAVIILPKSSYLLYTQIIYIISYVLEVTIVMMILFDKNHRGLHDYLAHTEVMEVI